MECGVARIKLFKIQIKSKRQTRCEYQWETKK